jgi:hypothetical protein
MRTPIKFGAAAVAGVLAVSGLGALTAIGENTEESSPPQSAEIADRVEPRVSELAREAQEAEAIEFAGALHDDRVTDYALAVYDNEVKRQEAERIAAAEAAAAAAAAAASSSSYSGGGGAGGNLAAIRACESGGNYATNTGNGYYGAYQFDQQTWNSVGGTGNPAAASPAEQDARAQALINQRGSSPWPSCG